MINPSSILRKPDCRLTCQPSYRKAENSRPDVRLPSFPRRRESSQPLNRLPSFPRRRESSQPLNRLPSFPRRRESSQPLNRLPSFPRRRESSQPLNRLDTRFRGYDELTGLAKVLTYSNPNNRRA